MAEKNRKSAYDELLDDAKRLTEDAQIPEDGDFSLEEILAEYGRGRQQKILAEVEERAEESSAAPERAPDEPSREETPPEPEQPTPAAGSEEEDEAGEPPDGRSRRAAQAEAMERAAERRAQEKLLMQTEIAAQLPRAPRPISMEEVVGRTVDAVMDETELLPEKKRRRGLFSRREYVETEELYQRPSRPAEDDQEPESGPEPPEAPAPIGPEKPLDEAAAESRAEAKRLRRPVLPSALMTVALAAVLAAEERGISIPGWSGNETLQTGVLLAVLAVVCILCRSVFARSVRLLARRRCGGETLTALAALAALADCATRPVLAGRSQAVPYAVAACAALIFAQWGGERAARGQYDACRTGALDDEPPYLVTDTPHGACKQAGRIRGFYTDLQKDSLPLLWQTALVPVILAATVVFAGLASLGQGRGQDFLLCWSAILSASASFALPLCWPLPWSRLSRQLQKDGCAVAGWAGAEAISRRRAVILTDADLFPPGTVRLNGIKVFGEEVPHAASYAASLIRASGSGLSRLFDELARGEGGSAYEVSDFSFYEEGGCSGVIRGESVLLGTASFMRKMEVRLPGNLNLRTGVFLAVERQLSAVFAVKYQAAENVDWALRMLRRDRITPILAARDPNITPALLKRKFRKGVRVEYPPLAARLALSEQEEGNGLPHALLLREGLLPYAEAVAGSRRLTRAARRCTVLALLGSASGTLLAFYLAFLGSFSLMTPVTLLAFLMLWTLPVLLLSGWSGRFG